MSDVVLKKINKVFGKTQVIHDVDLEVKDGEFVVFVGPSGCGKSTLLRLIAGLEDITSGELYIDGKLVNDAPPAKRGIGMVFQSYALYPHMTVFENMAFGLKHAGGDVDEVKQMVMHVAHTLQLDTLLDRKPRQLSGGQRQRVAIGRAIVREPKVFLFDEPLSNLDAALRVRMRMEIAKLHHRLQSTMIYVTHDQVEAMTLAKKIVVLRDGRVEQIGSPLELYNHPANLFVAGFIGSPRMNLLPAEIVAPDGKRTDVRLADGQVVSVAVNTETARVGEKVTLGIRPEHIRLGKQDVFNPEKGSLVQVVEHLGNESMLYVTRPKDPDPVVVRLDGQVNIEHDDRIHMSFPSSFCHLFDSSGKAFLRSSQADTSAIRPLSETIR